MAIVQYIIWNILLLKNGLNVFPLLFISVSLASCSFSLSLCFSVFPPSPQFCWSFVQTKAATPTHKPFQRTVSCWDRSVMTSWRHWQCAVTSWMMTSSGIKRLHLYFYISETLNGLFPQIGNGGACAIQIKKKCLAFVTNFTLWFWDWITSTLTVYLQLCSGVSRIQILYLSRSTSESTNHALKTLLK